MGDILAPDVQQPGAIHQVGKEHGLRAPGLELAPQLPELILGGPAGQVVGKAEGCPAEQGRPVLPEGAYQIHIHQRKGFGPCLGLVQGNAPAVQTQGLAGKGLQDELGQFGHPGQALLHQQDAAAVDLALRLKIVAGIHKQPGFRPGDQQVARAAGKAGHKGPGLVVGADIFAAVGVGGGHQIGVQALGRHGGLQCA